MQIMRNPFEYLHEKIIKVKHTFEKLW